MRVWVDLTNSPHVLVLRPLIELLQADGHEVRVTARDFAQTLALCERFGIEHTAIGHHRGGRVSSKALGLASRSLALLRYAREERRRAGAPFDLALAHGSNDITLAAAALRIPSATMFDYEWATVQHTINCRLARAVVVPEAIPPERLARYGAAGKLRRYQGLKEEYYLADFEPDEAVLDGLGLERSRPLVLVRTPPELSLYHRFSNDLFTALLGRLNAAALEQGVQCVVLPRTSSQAPALRSLGGLLVPERVVDSQSLCAFADVVVSAGGTMNREAVALGTPAYTTFAGRMGAVDERLIAEGRLHVLSSPEQLDLTRREHGSAPARVRRDPRELLALALSALDAAGS
jgi:predicted glycosyltransferase